MDTVGKGLIRADLQVQFVREAVISQLENAALRLHEHIQRLLTLVLGRGIQPNRPMIDAWLRQSLTAQEETRHGRNVL